MRTAHVVHGFRTAFRNVRNRQRHGSHAVVVLAVAVVFGLGLVPRAFGKTSHSQAFELVWSPGAHAIIRTAAHVQAPADLPPLRGDTVLDVFTVYRAGETHGAAIGTFIAWTVGMAEAQEFAAAGYHLFGLGRLEVVGQGSLDTIGTPRFGGTTYASIVGGSGSYAAAGGQCIGTPRGRTDIHVVCDIR